MLVLTRKMGETVVIGDNVSVTIEGIEGGKVRLGFQAPDNVSIHRLEVYKRIHAPEPERKAVK